MRYNTFTLLKSDDGIPLFLITTRNDDDIYDIIFKFDKEITGSDFKFKSSAVNGFDVKTMSIGSGLTIIDNHTLRMDLVKETRKPGKHTGAMKCYDEDGDHTIFNFVFDVKPKIL